MPREARVHCRALKLDQGKVNQALRGVHLLATSSPEYLGLGPPRKLLFSMPVFVSIFDDIQREAKVQGWFGESGTEEVLPYRTFRGVFFINGSSLGGLVSLAFESGRS